MVCMQHHASADGRRKDVPGGRARTAVENENRKRYEDQAETGEQLVTKDGPVIFTKHPFADEALA